MSKSNEISIFVDNVGRTIVGRVKETKTSLQVENPAIVNIDIKQDTGQIAVQLVPYIFKEFVAAEERLKPLVWSFPRDNVTTCDNLQVDDALKKQYANVYAPPAPPAPAPQVEEPEVVKVFDDE